MNEVVGIKEATCGTEAPVWEGWQCYVCGCRVYHNTGRSAVQEHLWSSYITDANPTCTKAGEKKRSCDRCLTVESIAIPALGHDYQRGPSVPASCTEEGHTARKECTRCGHFIGGDTTPPLGHNWGKPSYAWSPDYKTCTGTVICKRDPSHTHTVTAKVSSQESGPACAENHTVVYTADFPKNPEFETQTATVTGPQAEHTPKTIRAVAATCTKNGQTAGKKCSVCGEILQAPEITPALGHIEEAIPAVPATCVHTGQAESKMCLGCGTITGAPDVIILTDPNNHEGGTYKKYYETPDTPAGFVFYNEYCSSCHALIGNGHVKIEDADLHNADWEEKTGNDNGEVPVPVTEPASAWKEAAVDDSPADAPESAKPSGKADGKGNGKQGRKDKTDGKGIPGDADSPTKSKPEKADGGEAVPGDVAATDSAETDAPAKAEGGDGNGAVDPASEEVKGEGNDSDMPSQDDAVSSEGISGQDVGSDEGEKPARENESLNGVEQSVDGNSGENNIADIDADRIP